MALSATSPSRRLRPPAADTPDPHPVLARLLDQGDLESMRTITARGKRFDHGIGWFRKPTDAERTPAFVEHYGTGGGYLIAKLCRNSGSPWSRCKHDLGVGLRSALHPTRGAVVDVMAFDVERARRDTPGTAQVTHLNNAGAALPPTQATHAVV